MDVRFAPTTDGARIGYAVTGSGRTTVVLVPAVRASIEPLLGEPAMIHLLAGLIAGRRLMVMDARGTGFSDRAAAGDLTAEQLGADVEAVLDHSGTETAVLLAHSRSGPAAVHFAASRPRRTAGLVLVNACARGSRGGGYHLGPTSDEVRVLAERLATTWGTARPHPVTAPGLVGDQRFLEWVAWQERRTLRPSLLPDAMDAFARHDATADLPRVKAPTLVLHRRDDPVWDIRHGAYLAERIERVSFQALPGRDHVLFAPSQKDILRRIGAFLGSPQDGREALTPTEHEIARLVAQGLSNKQIAARRSISPFTVDSHLRRIYRKLAVHNRTQLARRI